MLRRARLCHSKLSVCPSVTKHYADHIGWDTSKIILRLISLESSLLGASEKAELCRFRQPHRHFGAPALGKPANIRINLIGYCQKLQSFAYIIVADYLRLFSVFFVVSSENHKF